jgi:TolA-binding protein
MPVEQKSESEKDFSELRREVIEARNLVIKTDNLLKNLHAELKAVGKRQEEFQTRQWISSAVAYVLFAVLCATGATMIVSARTSSASQERQRLEAKVAELTGQMEKEKADSLAVASAQRTASEVYKLMTTLPGDERLKGVDALVKLETTRLSPLERQALNDRANLLRNEIGQSAFERGKAAFRRNEMTTAAAELSRFVAMNPAAQDLLDASFFLGSALNALRKHDQAVPYLARFVSEDKRSKTRDYGMLLLASSYKQTGQLDKAADTAREALATYPNSQFAPQFRARLSAVKRLQNAGVDPAVLGGQPQVTVGSPAPAAALPAPAAVKPAVPAPGAPPGDPKAAQPAPGKPNP